MVLGTTINEKDLGVNISVYMKVSGGGMQPKMYFGGSLKLCRQYDVFYFPTMSSLVVRFAKKIFLLKNVTLEPEAGDFCMLGGTGATLV